MAYEILEGIGDQGAGEWIEDREKAFHLRRRLTSKEQESVGDAVDCRHTEEAEKRLAAMLRTPGIPPNFMYLVREELS